MKKISRRSFLTAMAAVSAAGVLTACGASSSTASSVASSVAASSETAASSEAAPESVTIKAFNGAKELVDVEVPFDPQRIAILDLASLDILDELGVGDRVVGTASTSLDYLQSYVTNDSIANLGNIKEADMEAVMACEPDIIFIGGRLSKSYDALCEIAPVVFLATDAEKGVVESTRENAMTIASIFGLEDQVESLMADFDSRIDALKAFAEGKTAIVGMTTSGSFNVLGNDGRCSIIGKEIGIENVYVVKEQELPDPNFSTVKVPNLIGNEWSNAQVSLNIKGLKHQLAESDASQAGAVVTYQYPRAGAEVPYGTTVYLYTDTYEGRHTEVPDVTG